MKPLTKPPTNQKAFDSVVQHFVIEGNLRSVSSDGACKFRGIDGAVCAVGLLFPKRFYDFEMESTPLDEVLQVFPKLSRWFHQTQTDLLADLQRWHDHNVDLQDSETVAELMVIGKQYQLDVSKIPQNFLPEEVPDVDG